MSSKLGQMLIRAGKISAEDLEEVLKCQVIFGGKLGTNLMEMGFIEEHELARFLGNKLGVPTADQEELMNIPANVIAIISTELAEKYKIIPFKLESKRLSLVMADPSDFDAIDAISFTTGYIIRPMVAPELRLLHCLEKYYGIKREMRYITLSGGSSRARKKKVAQEKIEDLNEIIVTTPEEQEERVAFPEFNGFDKLPEEETPEPLPTAATPTPADTGRYTSDQLFRDLVAAENRDDIAACILRHTGQDFYRAAFFVVKGGGALGWQGVAGEQPIADFDNLQIPFTNPSLLKIVADQKSFYLGPVPDIVMNSAMINGMGGGNVSAALLLPLLMMGRVVAILYLEGDSQQLSNKLKELQRLMAKASLAFEILIMKSKILMT